MRLQVGVLLRDAPPHTHTHIFWGVNTRMGANIWLMLLLTLAPRVCGS